MKVSVIIPTHNRSDLLERAVMSVLNQTYKELEVIVVSDGSTDNTDEIIDKLKAKDSRIKSLSYKPAQGANVARNKGIELADSEYVAFLDDDDEWYKDKLEKQMNIIQASPEIGLVYTGVCAYYVNEKEKYYSLGKSEGDLSQAILRRNVIGTTSTVLAKRDLVIEVGGFDNELPAAQDYDLWIRLCQITKVGVVKEAKILYYNYTNKKQISSNIERYEEARRQINEKYKDLFSTLTNEEKVIIKRNIALSRANLALRNRQKAVAIKYIFKSITIKPSKKNISLMLLAPFPYKLILKLRNLAKK